MEVASKKRLNWKCVEQIENVCVVGALW